MTFRPLCVAFSSALTLIASYGLVASAADKEQPAVAGTGGSAPVIEERELEVMWKDLARDDNDGVAIAYRHIRAMIQAPGSSVPFLKARLKPVVAPDAQRVGRWIDELDSNEFETREKATHELERVGVLAAPALKKKLEGKLPSLEARRRMERLLEKLEAQTLSPDELRLSRAVEVLFGAATPDARALLAELAKGAPGAPLTEDAKRCVAALAPITAPAGR